MRILLNMPSQFGGKHSGVARVAFSLLEHLLEVTDHDYVLRSGWERKQLPPALQHPRISVIVERRPRFIVFDVVRQALIMPALCRRLGIDVVLNLDPFGSPTGGERRLMIVHDLYFKTIADQIGWRATKTTDFIFRLMIRGCGSIVCVSNATRADLNRWYPAAAAKSLTIHSDSTLAVSPEEVSGARPFAERYILAVGNATSNKNFATLAKAFAALKPAHPDLRLVHVGLDPQDEILNAIGDGPARDAVTRQRGIDDRELAALYRHAACLCVPSLYEGFCLPVLEAQSLGCPVVCSNTSATPEIAGEGALTFDPMDAGALRDALERVLRDADLAEALRRKGFENRKRFSWRKAAGGYAGLLTA
jgi:glycosyltransferase involved in cell wall biosynthesis